MVRARKRARALEAAAKATRNDDDADDAGRRNSANEATTTTETIMLPRTSAPWFSRTLSVHEETSFETYYRRQGIVDEGEWRDFLRYLRSPLPVTFRMNVMASRREEVREALNVAKHFLQNTNE